MQDLKIALVQSHLHWEDKKTNLRLFSDRLRNISSRTDIAILPEMFSTGFSMKPQKLAETMSGKTVEWMMEEAKDHNFVVCGSVIIEDKGIFYNRLIWAEPNGELYWYNKRHLFSMAGEEKVYAPGTEKLVVTYKGWRICPMICYDLRFPVWTRNAENYDALIFVANWPERRIQHWRKLLQARAIENQCYVVGVNRVGDDGNSISHSGNSMFIDPQGEVEIEIENQDTTAIAILKSEEISKTRRYMPFLKDMDKFNIQ